VATTQTASKKVAVVDLNNPPTISGVTVTLTGETCFDVAETECAATAATLALRLPHRTDFSAGHEEVYTFTASVAVTNIQLIYTNTNGTVIASSSTSVNADNKSATLTANFATDLNTTAAGNDGTNPLAATVTVVFDYNGNTYWKNLSIGVKDCSCCEGVAGTDGRCYKRSTTTACGTGWATVTYAILSSAVPAAWWNTLYGTQNVTRVFSYSRQQCHPAVEIWRRTTVYERFYTDNNAWSRQTTTYVYDDCGDPPSYGTQWPDNGQACVQD
jgi:hypothetical protein